MDSSHTKVKSKRTVNRKALLLCMVFLFFSQMMSSAQITASLFTPSTTDQRATVSVDFKKVPLAEALQTLARKVNVGISYKTVAVPPKQITYRAKDRSIFKILDDILKDTGLQSTLSQDRKVIMIKKKPALKAVQQSTITGKVTDASSGEPVPGVNILVKGTSTGTSTDANGDYELTIESLQDTLVVSFIGYKTQEVPINGRTSVDIAIKVSTQQLGEIVVTGFGEESKLESTSSSSTIDAEKDIENIPVANVGEALQGSVAGADIRSNSGTPGSSVSFNIRGTSSINAGGKPLIIIDGTTVNQESVGFTGLRASSSQGILSSIDPQMIKNISVLKGPVATAQYGAQGANGVVVITTKEGLAGQTQFSVNYQLGTSSLATPYPKMVSAKQAAMLYREGIINAAKVSNNPVPEPKDIAIPGWDGQTNTKWAEIVQRDQPISQQMNLNAQGGTEDATYFGSLSYQNKKGTYIATGFERFGGTFNFKYNFNDHVDVSNHFLISHSEMNGNAEGAGNFDSPVAAPVFIPQTVPAYNNDGSINLNIPGGFYNPLWIAKNDVNRFQTNRIVNNTDLGIDLTEKLSFNAKLGIDYSVTLSKKYQNPISGRGKKKNGYTQDGSTNFFTGGLDYGFHYILDINDNNTLDARLIGTSQLYKNRELIAAGQDFAAAGLEYLASASTPVTATSSILDGKKLSFLGKVHYSYKSKLFFDGTLRREGDSRFAKDFRWGTFYGIGAGWLISSEDFFRNDVISRFKLRVNFGESGNNDIGRNAYQALLGYSANYNSQGGIVPQQLGNNLLTWERKRSVEMGFDFGLFSERVDGSFTYFHSKTDDLLYSLPISRTTGFSSQLTNVGALTNNGIEVSLNADILSSKDFSLSLNGNFTYVTNEIASLPDGVDGNPLKITSAYKRNAAIGHQVGEWYMKTYAGVDPQNGKPLWKLNDGSGGVTSDYKKAQRAYQGASGTPTHYGSFGLRTDYKGFFASATLFGSFGNKISTTSWAYYYQADGNFQIPGYTSAATQLNRWQKPGDKTNVPRRIAGGNNLSNTRNSTRYLFDGGFLRLRTVRLGYDFPASLLQNIGIRGIKIFLVGQNIWTHKFDSDLLWDPQVGNSGSLSLYGQTQKSYNLGANIKF